MAEKYRVGVIGFAHDVNELMRRFAELPNVEWGACADTVPTRPELAEGPSTSVEPAERAGEDRHPKGLDDYRARLEKASFDIVIFCPENSRHGEVAAAIAASGAHMLTEKPMAATLPEATAMPRAAQGAGVELFVNWPSTWSPAVRKAKQLLDEGAIGELWEVKWRAGSLGPLSHGATHVGTDGGARPLTDVEKGSTWWHHDADGGASCSTTVATARAWPGGTSASRRRLRSAFALTSTQFGDADDNAVITVRFPRAMAILEATWSCVDHGVPTGPILYGDAGTMVVEHRGDESVVKLIRGVGAEPEYISGDPLPAGRATLAEEIMHHLETGEPIHETMEAGFNLEAQAILDAGIRSARTGKLELVYGPGWVVGE
ncbi:MAG: Gfo/Idh/MocA family oxidoreductase [Chloroflexia bacterium]